MSTSSEEEETSSDEDSSVDTVILSNGNVDYLQAMVPEAETRELILRLWRKDELPYTYGQFKKFLKESLRYLEGLKKNGLEDSLLERIMEHPWFTDILYDDLDDETNSKLIEVCLNYGDDFLDWEEPD